MGCDIHLYVEKKENGKWRSVDEWYVDEDGDIRVPYEKRFYSDRNYDVFAILADVRNGRGFAGCDTGDGFRPIDAPRGVPEDASEEVKAEVERWGGDGHSHSFFTVAELLAYDWTQKTKQRGVVNGPEYHNWTRWKKKENEAPEHYCGNVGGGGVRKVSVEEMDVMVKKIVAECGTGFGCHQDAQKRIEKELSSVYTRIEWETEYYKSAERFLGRVIPRLLALGCPNEVRIVFFFDN